MKVSRKSMTLLSIGALFAAFSINPAFAQFVYPTADQHDTDPTVYKEDPFITKYRKKFFAVFKGDFKTFNTAYDEIQAMVKQNPKDARALVWLGNGETIKAGLAYLKGQKDVALKLLDTSRKTMDAAVALKPNEEQIFMMRAATLYVQGQYFPVNLLPTSVWTELAGDCQHLTKKLGPSGMKRISVHARGETYGEMGVALTHLGKIWQAKSAFEMVIKLDPNTDYESKAKEMIAKLPK